MARCSRRSDPPSRRRFLQSLSAGAIVAGAPRWAFARSFDPSGEQAPSVRDPKYREWSAAALTEAKRLGCRTLRLDSQTKLEAAVRLYRAHGFTEIPRYNDNPRADIWMERVL